MFLCHVRTTSEFVMVKLQISRTYFVIVSHQEFLIFYLDPKCNSWNFIKCINCVESIVKSEGSIECCAFSPCEKYFGICFDKNVVVYQTLDWSLLASCPGERRASSLKFFPSLSSILIADKSGCVTFYSLCKDKLEKRELALGHNSMLTSALISNNERYIITSDRDEKIRVTNYPNVYNIESYCLGHTLFVTCIDFLPTDYRVLISSSGDGTLRFWNFVKGHQIAEYDCCGGNSSDENSKTVVNFVTEEINKVSNIAVLRYKLNEVKILSVKGNVDDLNIEQVTVVQLKCIPWDVSYFNKTLVCLLPDASNPIVSWPCDSNVESKLFYNIVSHLRKCWSDIINSSDKILDEIPVLFKREVDNLQEYEQRKKARLLKTGKTS